MFFGENNNMSEEEANENEQLLDEELAGQLGELTTSAIYYSAARSPEASRPHSQREVVLHQSQSIWSRPFSCLRRLFGYSNGETHPLIPIHNVPSNSGTGTVHLDGSIGSIIFQFLERWLLGSLRNGYSSNLSFAFASLITILLISVILVLFSTGNLDLLVLLARTLLCQFIHSLQPSTLPSFCQI